MTNTNTLNDDLEPEASPKGTPVPLEQSAQLQTMLTAFGKLHDAIMHDTPVTVDNMETMDAHLRDQKFVISGQTFTAEELSNIPGGKRTLEIWEEIKQGSDKHTHELTLLTNEAAEQLINNINPEDSLFLQNLRTITDHQMEILTKGRVFYIDLSRLTQLSDAQAESLVKWRGKFLYLNGLTELSDVQAAAFGKWRGQYLLLNNLTSLSDAQARSLARFKGEITCLERLKKQIKAAKSAPSAT